MTGPHQREPVATDGAPLQEAVAAVVLVHGRGATARSMIQLAYEFYREEVAYLAPQAARNTWYPNSFLAPVEANEPGRSSGLQRLSELVTEANEADIPTERILVCGFSQGGCLASEFVARNPTQYGGLAVFSGGLIGESVDPEEYEGDLQGTPAFLGCSDIDPHIPESRVHETADVLQRLGASVDTRIYPGMAHTINEDEISAVSELLDSILEEAP